MRIFVMFILSRACVYDVINLSLLSCSLSTPKGQAKVVRFCEEKKKRENSFIRWSTFYAVCYGIYAMALGLNKVDDINQTLWII